MGKKVGLQNLVISLLVMTSAQIVYSAAVKYKPNEIIVKLREKTAETLQKQLEDENLAKKSQPFQYPGRITTRYKIKEIKPLIQDFQQRQERLRSLQREKKTLLSQKERHILRRLKRAEKEVSVPDLSRIYRIKVELEAGQSLEEVVELYREDPDVEYAELNYIISIDSIPNDPLYSMQWSLEKISAPEAWDVCTSNQEIIVAVIDTGADYNHRDLKNNIWINNEELNGIDGVDDDENGYVDDIYGYNFVYNNNDPMDDEGHGTHCCGVIAAEGNNERDISGICWNSKIMAVKFIGALGEGTSTDALLAVYYAVTNGADIISNSWGSDNKSDVLQDAIDYAYSQGVLIVAAAGNSNLDKPNYPAAYEHVISVTATDPNDDKWLLSNYGNWIDIAAPGVDIISLRAEGTSEGTVRDQYTTILSGTSMATPHIAGACALMLSANPLLTNYELYQKLVNSTDEIATGICSSNGRLNIFKVIRAVVPSHGYIRFEQDYYSEGSSASILLADWDIRGTDSQNVQLTTREGDFEKAILTETSFALGVFTGVIPINSGEVNTGDGVIQISHGDIIHATYYDVNDGFGRRRTSTDDATADYEVPVLLDVNVEASGRVARIQIFTDEPTKATIRCGLDCKGPYTLIQKSVQTSTYHKITLQPLTFSREYFFVVDLIDQAGNEITVDNNGACYSFTTPTEFQGFYVPGIYSTIQTAIDEASDGDTIWVADGIYNGEGNIEIDFKGKAIILKSENGPEKTIIDCESRGRGFHFNSGEDGNSVLDGFTITNGSGVLYGGGIRCTASSPKIINCIITNNSASDFGGGMYNCYNSHPIIINCVFSSNISEASCVLGNGAGICNRSNSSPTITNCTFTNNVASYSGGGMYNYQNSSPTVTNCTFYSNSAGWAGGGMVNWYNSGPKIYNCRFKENSAGGDGGGICNYYESIPIAINSIINNNNAEGYGGGIKNFDSSATLINCTIVGNKVLLTGGGIWVGTNSSLKLKNCIIWNNYRGKRTEEAAQIGLLPESKTPTINYCCIQNWSGKLGGIGNIGLEPLFVEPNNGDYHLKSAGWRWDSKRGNWNYDEVTSPCIDSGNPGSPLRDELLVVPDDPNNEWGINLRINMGAYGGTTEASMAPYDWSLLADITNDGVVNWRDFVIVTTDWFTREQEQPGDLNRDGIVGFADFALLAKNWMRHIKPPVVNIVNLQDGTTLVKPTDSPVEIVAEAWDIDGPVIKVEFFANGKKIGEDTDGSDGWSFIWQDYKPGVHTITAKAVAINGITTTSPKVTISITTPR